MQTEYARKTLAALWEGLCKLADADEVRFFKLLPTPAIERRFFWWQPSCLQDQLISIDEWINLLRKAQEKKEQKWFDEYERFMFKLFDVSCEFKGAFQKKKNFLRAFCEFLGYGSSQSSQNCALAV